jgi:ribosomal-protein-alanine N-acetyltransferase
MKVIIETERLIVREYVEDDAEAFFRLNSDPEVLRFVPDAGLVNVEEARKMLMEHPVADYRKHGFGRGACILKSTGENIGFAGLKYLEELGEVDVAYRFMRPYWGLGLASLAAFFSCHTAITATVQKVSDQVALSKPAPQLVANP